MMKFYKLLAPVLAATAIVCFIAFIIHFSTGIPQADDYPMMFKFLDRWLASGSFQEKYMLLTEQFLDHRMVAMKLTVLSVKALHGKMDINIVNAVGVVIWFATLLILYKAFLRSKLPLIYFIPVLFFTLHPGFGFDGLLWAATWMAFPWAIFLTLASFYFLIFHPTRAGLIGAWLLAFFALFSHGNGIFAFLIGMAILIYERKKQRTLLWLAFSCLGFLLFFFNYKSGGTSENSPVENLLHYPHYVLSSMGAFAGGSLYFPDLEVTVLSTGNLPAIVFGWILCAIILGYCVYLLWNLFKSTEPINTHLPENRLLLFCSAIGIFIVGTAAMISAVRTHSYLLHGFAARYHFYSALLISVVYIMALLSFEKLRNLKFSLIAVSISLLYCAGQYWYQTDGLANHVRVYQAGLYNSKTIGQWILYIDARFWERGVNAYSNEMLWTEKSENFKFPAVKLDTANPLKVLPKSKLPKEYSMQVNDRQDEFSVHVKGPLFQLPAFGNSADGSYLNLVSPTQSILYPLNPEREGLRQFLTGATYYKPEANLMLRKKWLPSGFYKLYLFVIRNGRKTKIDLEKNIFVKAYPLEI